MYIFLTSDTFADLVSEREDNSNNIWEIEVSPDSYSIFNLPSIDKEAETVCIYINRQDCCQEMISLYKDEEIVNKKLNVEFLGESGAEAGGLTKEVFHLFWKDSENKFFDGEETLVPYLPLHRIRKEADTFIILGRLFAHMLLLTNTVPTKLSKTLYFYLSELPVDNNMLQEEFLLYVPSMERFILKKALSDFKSLTKFERDTLLNMFNTYQFYENPNESDISDQISTISTVIFIERPKALMQKFKSGIPTHIIDKFWKCCKPESINHLLSNSRPTTKKIIDCIKPCYEDLTNDESRVLHYLLMFVASLDQDEMLEFLFFVTGTYSLSFDTKITINFNKLHENLRRPISHTCGNTLELSSTYTSYREFKNEMNTYLKCPYLL